MADPIYTSASPIAVNPANGELIGGATFTVHAPDDTSFSTPLAVTDPVTGVAISPLRSNSNGTLPAFTVAGDLPRVKLKSGAFVTELVSLGGLVSEQINAAGLAPSVVAAAIAAAGTASTKAGEAAAAAGAASAAAATATQKASAVAEVVATNDGIMTTVFGQEGSAFRAALTVAIADGVEAAVAPLGDRVSVLESRQGGGNLVGFIGDSITAGESNTYIPGGYSTQLGDSPAMYAYALSDGRWRMLVNAGVGGQRSDQIRARMQTEIIDVGCTVCVITSFYWNNIGQGRTVAQTVADLDEMFTFLRAGGVAPVVCLPTPDGSSGTTTARKLARAQMSVAVANLCRSRGVPIVDPFPALVDVGTGVLKTAYLKPDNSVHPLPAGYRAFGALITVALERLIAPGPSPEAVTAVDPTDLLGGKGLFLADTSGVAAGWGGGADAAWSIVTDPDVTGRMQQVSVSAGSSYKDMLVGNTGTHFAAGDVLEMSGLMTYDGGTALPRVRFVVGGSPSPNTFITFEPRGPLARGRFCMRWKVPAGSTSVSLRFQMQMGSGAAAIGQVAVRNISA